MRPKKFAEISPDPFCITPDFALGTRLDFCALDSTNALNVAAKVLNWQAWLEGASLAQWVKL